MKTPMLESLFNKAAGLKALNFLKKRLQDKCFPMTFMNFLRTPFFTEHLRWLLHRYTTDQQAVSFFKAIFKFTRYNVKITFLECFEEWFDI